MTVAVHPSIMIELVGSACGMGYTYLMTVDGLEGFSRIDLCSMGNCYPFVEIG